jgi:Ni/Co efflux regulator RcnB
MKKLLIPAAALAVALSAPLAMADDQNDHNNRTRQERSARPDTSDRSGERMTGPDTNAAGGGAMQGGAMQGPDNRNRDRGNDNDRMRNNDNDRTVIKNNDNDKTVIKNNDNDRKVVRNKTVVRKTVDRSVVLKFRANIKAPHRYHWKRTYVRPAGWYPHRWVYGERLPAIFFAPEFFILDYAAYGLIEPWGGYEWVRYGDDAVLIDLETGEVVRVEYDIFY